MSFSKEVSFSTKEGGGYLIIFSEFKEDIIPEHIKKPVVDVSIVITEKIGVNNSSTLMRIASIIRSYLDENDVLLYCFCDNKEIIKSKNHFKLSYQGYRSLLFSKLYERSASNEYANKLVIIDDEENGNHYIHLISRHANINVIEELSETLMLMNK